MNTEPTRPAKANAPTAGATLRLLASRAVAAFQAPAGLDHNQIVRIFVRLLLTFCVRTFACIPAAALTEAGPTTAPALSVTRLRLCPNTRRSWVPVVTQENCTCQTATRRAALCGSSTPTIPNNHASETNQTGQASQPVIGGTPGLPPAHSSNHPNPAPTTRVTLVASAGWTGLRTGGPSTTASTVAAAPTRCPALSGGF